MSKLQIELKVETAWWVWIYVYGVSAFCRITGFEPDLEKINAVVMRGIKVVSVTRK